MNNKNLNDVSFQDIMNAASKLSDATKADYSLESLSVWTDYHHLNDFLGKYKTYKDSKAKEAGVFLWMLLQRLIKLLNKNYGVLMHLQPLCRQIFVPTQI